MLSKVPVCSEYPVNQSVPSWKSVSVRLLPENRVETEESKSDRVNRIGAASVLFRDGDDDFFYGYL